MFKLFKKDKSLNYKFTCSCCGKTYDEMPLCFGSDYPAYYYHIPEDEIKERIEITTSLCIIDDYYFHRGRLSIPIISTRKALIFNVWTTISKDNFELRNSLWNNPERVNQNPYFGYLNNVIPTYQNTLNLKVGSFENEVGYIPTIEIIDESHPLFHDQKNGITWDNAVNKVKTILKGWPH